MSKYNNRNVTKSFFKKKINQIIGALLTVQKFGKNSLKLWNNSCFKIKILNIKLLGALDNIFNIKYDNNRSIHISKARQVNYFFNS